MKVLHIITGLFTGGAEMMLYKVLSKMDQTKFEFIVISLIDKGTVGDYISSLNIPVYCLNLNAKKFSLKPWLELRHIVIEFRPDLIQGWMYHGNFVALIASFFCPKSTVVFWNIRHSIYSLKYEKYNTALLIKLGKFLSGFTEKIIYNSQASTYQHKKLGYKSNKTVVIPNGFDIIKFKPSQKAYQEIRQELNLYDHALLIGLIGRYHLMKDHENFLKAAYLLVKNNPKLDVYFLLCGREVDKNNLALKQLIRDRGLSTKIHLLGERHDIPRITAALDIATSSSSHGEAFPNVIGEAMSCGVPCVVTDIGDSAFLVGDTGKVILPKNAKALFRAWEELIKIGTEGRKKLGQAARTRILEHFSLDSVVSQYEILYQNVANR